MDQERKNLRSTALQEGKDDFFPPQTQTKEYELFVVIEKMEPQPTPPRETAYSDQTGRFPHISSRGNQYILFCTITMAIPSLPKL